MKSSKVVRHRHGREVEGAIAGALAGATIGALAGPSIALVGALVGAGAGVAIAALLARNSADRIEIEQELAKERPAKSRKPVPSLRRA